MRFFDRSDTIFQGRFQKALNLGCGFLHTLGNTGKEFRRTIYLFESFQVGLKLGNAHRSDILEILSGNCNAIFAPYPTL